MSCSLTCRFEPQMAAGSARLLSQATSSSTAVTFCGAIRSGHPFAAFWLVVAHQNAYETHKNHIKHIKTAGHMRIETGRFLFELSEQTPCWMRLCCYIWIFRGKHRRWTNHRWLSALHRAACYPTKQSGEAAGGGTAGGRFSLPVFFHPKQSQIIETFPSCVRSAAQRVNH
jgi:hypothetical protein